MSAAELPISKLFSYLFLFQGYVFLQFLLIVLFRSEWGDQPRRILCSVTKILFQG